MPRFAWLALLLGAFAAPAWCEGGDAAAVSPIKETQKNPGYGTVVSVKEVRVLPERSAAAGGSAPGEPAGRPAYRVTVRMADGSLQVRDLHKPEFKPGDNVLLTNAGDMVKD